MLPANFFHLEMTRDGAGGWPARWPTFWRGTHM